MIKKLKLILLIFFLMLFAFLIFYIGPSSNVILKVNKINEGYKGIIVKKYSIKKGVLPTHLTVKTINKTIEINPDDKTVDQANIGDSIIKPKNENYVYLVKPDGSKKKYFYTKLSFKTRNHKKFPMEWKKKWLESSEWDKKK